ncbi:MAG: aminoacyl-tRNA hydrolase [Bacteroidetes bacterium GWF2_33_16]|nr:MAG: aminoacyl-tRNA hydrolase [Bacteroidetes bacterium GWE2_32_14]OFY08852.1 MAG: aminoacyl-tRNA hydrolase [Bacteroidetes bacterium GWF2_33_16]
MKYLIVGLGNIGDEYVNTRHNVGFQILDAFAKASNISFQDNRLAFRAEYKLKGRTFILIKPTTYMNLSGRSVNYWLQKEKIPVEKLLVLVDDIAIPFGTMRLRPKGGDAGHNGLANINLTLGHQNYTRLRFGLGDNFPKGFQVQYVLGEWTDEEKKLLPQKFEIAAEIIKSFGLVGLENTMNQFNKK